MRPKIFQKALLDMEKGSTQATAYDDENASPFKITKTYKDRSVGLGTHGEVGRTS